MTRMGLLEQISLKVLGVLVGLSTTADPRGLLIVEKPRAVIQAPPPAPIAIPKPELPPVDPNGFEVRLNDDSRLKLALADETIEIAGRYGTLRIPTNEILRIEFATRVTPDTKQQIDKALADLGSGDEELRQNAASQLTRMRHAAFPAIALAAKDAQSPAGQQATALVGKLQGTVGEKDFAPRETDRIYTVDDTIAGMIVAPALRVRTAQFGELALKLSDVRSLHSQSAPAEETDNDAIAQALTDPGTLSSFYAAVGQVLKFRVIGDSNGAVWGTDVYTADSSIAAAAVHAGVLAPGVSGVVRVKLVNPPTHFRGSPRNGVDSDAFGAYPKAYQFVR